MAANDRAEAPGEESPSAGGSEEPDRTPKTLMRTTRRKTSRPRTDIFADIFGKVPRQHDAGTGKKLFPVMVRVFDAAFRLGYHSFKDAARFVLQTIREKIGAEVADAVTIDHLQGAYIAMSGGKELATAKRDVVSVESKPNWSKEMSLTSVAAPIWNEIARTQPLKTGGQEGRSRWIRPRWRRWRTGSTRR